jgi:hypothetical protein
MWNSKVIKMLIEFFEDMLKEASKFFNEKENDKNDKCKSDAGANKQRAD